MSYWWEKADKAVQKFGANPTLTTATDPEDIWDAGALWVAPTAARTHAIVSTDNTNDKAAGTGALTVEVQGLDANWAPQKETITMTGTTPVNTASTYIRIFRMKVLTAGSTGANTGTITATAAAPDSTVTAQMTIGKGQTLMAIYTTPATSAGAIVRWYGAVNAAAINTLATFQLYVRPDASAAAAPFLIKQEISVTNNGFSPFEVNFRCPIIAPPKSDIVMRCAEVSGNTGVQGGFDILHD